MINVGDIRNAIKNLPDSAQVVVLIRSRHMDGADGGHNQPRIAMVAGVNGLAERLEIDINGFPPDP